MVVSFFGLLVVAACGGHTTPAWFAGRADARDELASAGGQRICRVGSANAHVAGGPHDAMYPLPRFVHWMSDDDILTADSNAAVSDEFGSDSDRRPPIFCRR